MKVNGDVLWPGINVNNEYLYEHLVQIVGTEGDIRYRQRLFLLKDIIESIMDISNLQHITSGSISEGLDLPGSDLDIMFVIGDVEVVNIAENIKFSRKYTNLMMETDPLYPGFTRLKLAADDYHSSYRLIKDSLVQRLQTNKNDTLRSFINNCYCPNYFIPEQNMFQGKVNRRNNKRLLSVLHSIECGGTAGLISNLFSEGASLDCLAPTIKCKSFAQLDFFFYKYISFVRPQTNINNCYRGIIIADTFLQTESSSFVRNECKWWIDSLNHFVVQLLPRPFSRQNIKNKQNRYHKHLLQSLQTDAVNGWLLYASLNYVIGQYKVTLRITDYVLSKCTHDKLYIGRLTFHQDIINNYAKNICTKHVTLNEKAKLATITHFTYLKRSSLIPAELRLEVENEDFFVHPVVLTHCLRFLCFHNLGETYNTLQSLRALNLIIRESYFVTSNLKSESFTILGVCCELSGDIDSACLCYDTVLHIHVGTNCTAEIRKKELLKRRNVTILK
ncbi:unnamed protein product [Mytilus coruscus]|uniref:Uncharacterized protein n=1 Tax=Mytilus coruscus TaxID=42192 RepID=A0A6J8C3B5_MYTCO|nr:unnamed protein product [Mytilus coruscus]